MSVICQFFKSVYQSKEDNTDFSHLDPLLLPASKDQWSIRMPTEIIKLLSRCLLPKERNKLSQVSRHFKAAVGSTVIYYACIIDSKHAKALLNNLQYFSALQDLRIHQIRDDQINLMKYFTKLETLMICSSVVTIEGLSQLNGLNLKQLTLYNCTNNMFPILFDPLFRVDNPSLKIRIASGTCKYHEEVNKYLDSL